MKNLFKKIMYFDLLESSNTYLIDLHKCCYIDTPLVVVANNQKKGRGRRGKKWFSDPNSLTFSFAIPITHKLTNWNISMITSLALINVLNCYNIKAVIKYPNDIIINNKKVAGILTEVISLNKTKHCIVGVGLNVNNELFPQNISNAVSIKNLIFETINKEKLLDNILLEISSLISVKNIINLYMSALYGSKSSVLCVYRGSQIYVKVLSVTNRGVLTILIQDQTIRTVNDLDISFILS